MSLLRDQIEARLRGETAPAPAHLTFIVDRGSLAVERVTAIARHMDPATVDVVIDRRQGKDRRVKKVMREHGRRRGQRRVGPPFSFTVRVAIS